MAQLTIKDILGSDNIASSRVDIASNFKTLVDGINKIETFLDTSPTGGTLAIGVATLKRYSKPITDIIFSCQASATIAGNLTIGTIGSGTTVTFNSAPTFNYASTFTKDLTVTKLEAGNTVSIETLLSISDRLVIPVGITTKTSVGAGTIVDTSDIPVSLNLLWDTATATVVSLSAGEDGQILIIRNDGTVTNGDTLEFVDEDEGTIFSTTIAVGADIAKVKMILQYTESIGWELLSIVGATATIN